ncbi:MAG: nicotinate-nucleotide--dimethylbenzimidazole phosphoribosyltransferase [Candidatus Methanospirare jalkutatii]|nr:nicotinate-nucleotide--dimethylbenzimidazole phosphoribosyltransferase [Candidatus Methanospirare jalkutatii]
MLSVKIPPLDEEAMRKARERQDRLTKPKGSLGFLEEISVLIAGMTANERPRIEKKLVLTLAADHGVAEEGVSVYPREVTAQMVRNFLRGGAAINVLARHVGARHVVVDVGVAEDVHADADVAANFVVKKVAYGTRNFLKEPAMSREQAERAVRAGMEVLEEEFERSNGLDIIAVGDMGIANTTASSAVVAALTGAEPEDVTGRGTGISEERFRRKVEVVKQGIERNKPFEDALDVLAKVGGFEIGGIAGVILAAAARRVPVLIDGFIASAGALLAYKLNPHARNYMLAGHLSAERGHAFVLNYLNLRPILQLDMRLGEGTGAALAISIVEAACKILDEMHTFEEAGVSENVH